MGSELWSGQAQNWVNSDFEVKFDLEGQGQLPPQNNRDINQGLLHLWSKFGDPSLNGSRVIARTSKWLTHTQTDRHTHTQTQATTKPEGQNWPRVMNHQSTKVRTNSLNGVQWRGPQLEIIIDKTRYWMWSTAYDWCYHGNGNRSTHLRFTAVIIVLWKADVPTIQLTTTWPKSLYSHSTDNIKDKNNTASHRMSDTWCKQYTDIKQVNWHHSGPKLYDWPWQGCCRHQASQFMSLLSICSLPLKMAIFLHLLPHHHDYYYLERVPLMTLSRCCA